MKKSKNNVQINTFFVVAILFFSASCYANDYDQGVQLFNNYYKELSGKYRKGNEPRILGHGKITEHSIVLIHGITDSPYYMLEIGKRFKEHGLNVVLLLLDAHGLKNPKNTQEEGIGKEGIYKDWKKTVENAVKVASLLSEKSVSIGGLSTGGALSVYQVLDKPDSINGGVFLFSAALSIDTVAELAGKTHLLGKIMATREDNRNLKESGCDTFPGEGANPYKYPIFPVQGGLQLSKMIDLINDMMSDLEQGVENPVFAAHSVFDTEAKIGGIVNFLKIVEGNRVFYILSQPEIAHASVVLKDDIELTPSNDVPGCMNGKSSKKPLKNPHFSAMMDGAIDFFDGFIGRQ